MLIASDRVCGEIQREILEASRSLVQDLAPEPEPETQNQVNIPLSVHSYPEVINLQLFTEHGKLKVIKRDDLPIRDFHPPFAEPLPNIELPQYQASDIQFSCPAIPWRL